MDCGLRQFVAQFLTAFRAWPALASLFEQDAYLIRTSASGISRSTKHHSPSSLDELTNKLCLKIFRFGRQSVDHELNESEPCVKCPQHIHTSHCLVDYYSVQEPRLTLRRPHQITNTRSIIKAHVQKRQLVLFRNLLVND